MGERHLTRAERETVIVFSDVDDVATISTHQQRVITALGRNPAAKHIKDISFGTTPGGEYELPAKLVSLRRPMPKASAATRKKRVRALTEARTKKTA
jgi:hypothetical protein